MPMGNLKTFLSSNANVEIEKKIFWIKGIAAGFIYLFIYSQGMLHISQEGIVHRDLGIYWKV
jgi:hypothetical protein